jgi:hypothetical protein
VLDEEKLQRSIRGEIDAIAARNFDVLRGIPSTHTWQVIDYVAGLEAAERDSLFDAFAANALFLFLPNRSPDLHAAKTGDRAYLRLKEAMPLIWHWKYQDVRTLRAMLADSRSSRPLGFLRDAPPDVIARAESILPTSAAEIRKAFKAAFSARFSKPRVEKLGGGYWHYFGLCGGREFRLGVDYGGRGHQLRYEVFYDHHPKGVRANRLTYEGMLGMGLGWWDFVTAQNLGETVAMLCDLVERLVTLPERWQL